MATMASMAMATSFHLPSNSNRAKAPRYALLARASNQNSREAAVPSVTNANPSLDRREALLAAAGLSLTANADKALAAPVGDPNLKTCGPAVVKDSFVACCPPKPKQTIDFTPDTGVLRVRPAAHKLNSDYIAKYNLAYSKMKALPRSDPRSFEQQANVHCVYCNFGYRQEGDGNKLQIHFNWLFLPWHRLYLYYHEKILGSLIGDPSFALPFWNWDNQEGGAVIPSYFNTPGTALYDVERNQDNLTKFVDLGTGAGADPSIANSNLNVMFKSVADVKAPSLFFGGVYRKGDPEPGTAGGGTVEAAPHTSVHKFGGKPTNPYKENLGNFYSAGRDPLFYSHHSNVDRMWSVWRTLPGNKDISDPDYLNVEFVFYDENSNLVKCKVKDCLDTEAQLRYKYAPVPEDSKWINYTAPSVRSLQSLVPQNQALAAEVYPEVGTSTESSATIEVKGEPVSFVVKQPSRPKSFIDEVLSLEKVTLVMDKSTAFNVFINYPEANKKTTLACAEYVGSFSNLPHFMPGMSSEGMTRTTNARFTIKSSVATLGLASADKITVTIVPVEEDSEFGISFKGANIAYL